MNALKKQYEKSIIRDDGCWSWRKVPLNTGYATVYAGKKNILTAHRVSWMIHKGEIPKGMQVLHKCDNRICTNPEHLFLGTQKDNVDDMIKKGRYNIKRR